MEQTNYRMLIEFGVKNKNGRTYLKHQMSNIPEFVPCTLDHAKDKNGHSILNPPINGEYTCAMAKVKSDNTGIYIDVVPYSDKKELFDNSMMNGCSIVPAGTGSVNEKGEVEDFRLHHVFLTMNPS